MNSRFITSQLPVKQNTTAATYNLLMETLPMSTRIQELMGEDSPYDAATSPEINTPASAKLAHKTPLRRPLIAHPIQMQME